MQAEGIPASPGYVKPMHLVPALREGRTYGTSGFPFNSPYTSRTIAEYAPGLCPVAEAMSDRMLSVPINEKFTKSGLAKHLSAESGVDTKSVKGVLGALEATMFGCLHKKGAGQFTLPGLLRIQAQAVAAKPRRQGKDPFTGQERWFEAKPATVRVRARPLKKLKDAAR